MSHPTEVVQHKESDHTTCDLVVEVKFPKSRQDISNIMKPLQFLRLYTFLTSDALCHNRVKAKMPTKGVQAMY